MSLMNFPDRGHWGDARWRGNCSGHVYRELFERFKPGLFVDPMVGGGTSLEVAKEMGVRAVGLDLHSGFNALRDSILGRVGEEADLVFSHPPYHDMIVYSGEVWGSTSHPDDLSHCKDDEDFSEKLALVLMNQRYATKPGGVYGTLIGDMRRNGRYSSYQAECIARMPASELASVIIKLQHNTMSGGKSYGKMKFPRIEHEYLLLWKRSEMPVYVFLKEVARKAQSRLQGAWKNVVRQCLMELGGKSDLQALYKKVADRCDKVLENQNWQAKVRQVVNQNPDQFRSVERGVWALA
jgi:hypothetical protein